MRMGAIRSGAAPRVKALLFDTPFYSVFRRVLPSRRLAILRYHAICDPRAGYADPGICVSPAAFEGHVAYLARHYSVLPLPEAVAALKRGATLPPNAVAVTFDDGYADNLAAARVLHRFGLSGTFYITAGCLAGEAPFWPAEIRALIPAVKARSLNLIAAGKTVQIPLGNDAERRAALKTISRLFKGHTIPVRESLREQLRSAAGGGAGTECMLRWEGVAEMSQLGMTIGSHTVTHPNLPSAGEADAWREIHDSKVRLERELGRPVTMFSYPNGGAERYMTPAVAELVRRAGFEAATTSRNAFAGPGSDPYALERVQVSERLADLVFSLEVERIVLQPRARPLEVES
jgi:peptidoglycan/xylan/chitin deacetylase (PgdA/CDA1 family)